MPERTSNKIEEAVRFLPLCAVIAIIGLAVLCQFDQFWSLFFHKAAIGDFAEYNPEATSSFRFFTSTSIRSIAPQLAALLLLLIITARFVRAIVKIRSSYIHALSEGMAQVEGGASVIEFVLLLPFLLTVLLLTLQIALLVQAKFVVNYAAFCAVRSAIVTIPAKISSAPTGKFEDANSISSGDADSPKMGIIRRAAALPCTAISPAIGVNVELATGTSLNTSIYSPLTKVATFFPAQVNGRFLGEELLKRANYAYDKNNTTVEVIREGGQAGGAFHDHELVTVRVKFRYYLAVPIANHLLGTPYNGGGFLGRLFGASAWYYPITEQYTLPIEGEPLFPDGGGEVETDEYE